jgi:hypothetical protein
MMTPSLRATGFIRQQLWLSGKEAVLFCKKEPKNSWMFAHGVVRFMGYSLAWRITGERHVQ